MAVSLQGTPSVYENASATSAVVPYPSGVTAGELLLAQVVHTQSTSPSSPVPSGWFLLESKSGTSGGPGMAIFYRWADGTESGSVTFTTSSTAGRVTGIMSRWTGVASVILDVAPSEISTGAQQDLIMPGLSTATAGVLLLHSVSIWVASAADINTPTGLTKIAGSTTIGRKLSIFTELQMSPGGTGDQTFTQTGTPINWTAITIPLRPDGVVVGPAMVQRTVGIPATDTDTSGIVNVKVTNATSVRLRCSTDAAGTTGVVYGSPVTPSSNGDARLTISGLTANTRYYYHVLMTNEAGEIVDGSTPQGRLKTAPSGPASFSFTFGSCNTGNSTTASTAMANRNDDLSFHLGDLYYHDGSGTSLSNFRTRINAAIVSQKNLFATTNMHMLPSDHDGMNNDSAAGSQATAWTNWNIARSELYPNPYNYFAFNWGRVRFVMLDTRSFKDNPADTDDSSKSALGATQKQWLKDEVDALPADEVMIIGQDGPWITGADTGDDGWGGFITERDELAAYFAASTKNIIIIAGDMHALAAEDGSGSPGGVPVFHAAPLNQTSSHKGGPYDVGPYPSAGLSVQQYGRVTVTDSGDEIEVLYKGYSASGTERVTMTKTYVVATGTQIKLHRAEVGLEASTEQINLHRTEVFVSAGGSNAPKLHRVEVAAVGSADPGPNVSNLESGLLVQMDAAAPGEPESYTWDQIAGPSVALTLGGTGDMSCSYVTPDLLADAELVFRVIAHYADGTQSGDGITRHGVVRNPDSMVDSDTFPGSIKIRPVDDSLVPDPDPDPTPPGYQPMGVPGNWELEMSDDFQLFNSQMWTPYWFESSAKMAGISTDAANVSVANGEISLKLSGPTTGAVISTNPHDGVPGHTGFEFTYGYVEARIFFPGNGATAWNWPAFWTRGQTWPDDGENDIAEVAGWEPRGRMTANYHSSAGEQNSGTIPGNWSGGWHTYGLHRKPGQCDVYYDGSKVWSYLTYDGGEPHYLILNIGQSVANNVYGDQSKVRIDYVRAWADTTPVGEDGVMAATTYNWGPVIAGDEFSYTGAPDPAKWNTYDGPGHNGNGVRSPDAFHVADGILTCTGTPDGTTGGMSAIFANQVYGRWECRMKTSSRDPKYHPVLILWPTAGWDFPNTCWEIDYAEGFGSDQEINFVNHHACPGQTMATMNIDTTQWHNYAVEWTATSLKGYIDGVLWYELTTTSQIPNVPMYQTIQLDWFPNGAEPTIESTMDVAWCRVYNL